MSGVIIISCRHIVRSFAEVLSCLKWLRNYLRAHSAAFAQVSALAGTWCVFLPKCSGVSSGLGITLCLLKRRNR